MSEKELTPQVTENINKFDTEGSELQQVEDMYLDGIYDEELFVQRIEQYKATIGLNFYNMGRTLIVMKENCGHGNFMPLLERMDITRSTAQKSMAVAAKFNTPKLQQLMANFSNQKGLGTKLLSLAVDNDDDLENLLEEEGSIAGLTFDDIDRMSSTELKKALRKSTADAIADKEANDRLMADKNDHADTLAKKLAKAQGIPQSDRWPENVAILDDELTENSRNCQQFLFRVIQIIQSMATQLDEDTPVSVYETWAKSCVSNANNLEALVAELQTTITENFAGFVDQPTYLLSDPLQLNDKDQS